jgi:hypothetical protein
LAQANFEYQDTKSTKKLNRASRLKMIIASNCTSIVVTGNIVGGLKEAKLSNYNQIIEAK